MKVCTATAVVICISLIQECKSDESVKLTIMNRRNFTGHWIAQVKLEHADNGGPIQVHLDHSIAKHEGGNIVIVTTTVTGPPGPPGEGYELIPGFGYYKFYGEAKAWQEAVLTCQAEGGHLLIPNSDEEFQVVKKIWDRNPSRYTDWRKSHIYIGLTDKGKEGQWVSILGETINATGYTKWGPGQPDGSTREDCLLLTTNTHLHDVTCSAPVAYMCEIEM